MRSRIAAAAGALTLAAVVGLPAAPAYADGVRNDQWYLKSLNIAQAHALSKGSGVTVAVMDTGVYPHPDLKRNVLAGANFLPGGKGDGRTDPDGHGTNMAALIAAYGKNGDSGVLGLAPSAKILPIKIADKGNALSLDGAIKGVGWAVDNGAKVINISAATGPSAGLIDAVNDAIDDDVVVVASVGNTGQDSVIGYPAAIEGVIAVGAVDKSGNHASLSLIDKRVDICAPGVDITTAEPKDRYADADGTSLSTAIVAGAVALVRSKFPGMSGPEVVHRLEATADDIGPAGRDDECGYGKLNVVKALTADVAPLGSASASAAAPAASATGNGKAGYIDPAATTAAAQPEADDAEPASSSTPLIFGVLAGLVVAGGVIALLVVRRRRSF
ncbi:S8 family serine peptidase [Actinoplanes sp. NPDC051513]|uniref:S8 family serine peptidase n=1 Tax=Actinoplanes sp. NPDC051513 TaxID=3363908 RepID=UPI003797D985